MATLPPGLTGGSSQDLISVAGLRFEFEVPDGSQDEQLAGYIRAGAEWASNILGGPILDATKEITALAPATPEGPVWLRQRFVRSVVALRYWTPDGRRAAAPDAMIEGAVMQATLGETEVVIWPPGQDYRWPAMLEDAPVAVTLQCGLDMESDLNRTVIRRAIILAAREFQFGAREIADDSAAYRLLDPLRISIYTPSPEV